MDEKCLSEAFSYYLSFFTVYLLMPSIPTLLLFSYLTIYLQVFSSVFSVCQYRWMLKEKVLTFLYNFALTEFFTSHYYCSTLLLLHVKLKCGLTWKPCSLLQLEFKSWSIGLASWSMCTASPCIVWLHYVVFFSRVNQPNPRYVLSRKWPFTKKWNLVQF